MGKVLQKALLFLLIFTGSIYANSQTIALTTLGTAYTQNFNTLSNTAGANSNNLVITGWYLTETGGGARDNEQYGVDTGGSTTGDTYSYGASAATDRALGGLRNGTLIPLFGAAFTNNTGSTITSLTISYTGEEWRLGTASRGSDQLNFQYSTNATDLNTGTWTSVSALNFATPDIVTVGAKNGNAASERTNISTVITGLNIANGATFWIRWTDTDATGADDGLAVDDFSLTPNGPTSAATISGNQTICSAGPATLTFNVTGSGIATVTYQDNYNGVITEYTTSGPANGSSFTSFINNLPAGTHKFTVATTRDANGTTYGGTGIATVTVHSCTVCSTASFNLVSANATDVNPQFVAIGDLNGDGKPDLVVPNYDATDISVLLGNGDGTFNTQIFIVGTSPVSVAIADLNGDSKPDLAVANSSDNTISVLLGNGDGTFGAASNFAVGTLPLSVAIADLNSDGKPDIVTANGGNTVSVLLGNGDGTFASASNLAVVGAPYSVVVADMNGDGKPDIATANNGGNNVSVLLGNGNGSFGSVSNFAVGGNPRSIATGDLNGDGKPDLVTANNSSDNVSVLLGNGNGTFGTASNFAVGTGPISVAVGDVNGDGKSDVAVVNVTDETVSVFLGNGDGTFGTASNFAPGSVPVSVAIGYLDGDGKPDLAVANSGENTVAVLVNNCVATVNNVSATISGDQTICSGGVASLTFSATGSGLATITYSDSQGGVYTATGNADGSAFTATIASLSAGTHTFTIVVVQDATGSGPGSGSATVISFVTSTPVVTAGGSTTFCSGGSVTLNSSSATGNQWYKDASPIAGATAQTYNATSSGTYFVAVSQNGCPAIVSATITVTVNTPASTPTIVANTNGTGTQDQACPEQPLMLTAIPSGATSYQWYKDANSITGETSSNLLVTTLGTYYVTATSNGCTSVQSAGYVVQNPTPGKPVLTAGGTTTFCSGGNVQLTSSSATGIQWYKDGSPIVSGNNQNYIANSSGSYMAILNALGCHSQASNPIVVTVNPPTPVPTVTANGPTSFCTGGSVTLTSSSATTYQWIKDGNIIAGATSQTYNVTASGDYSVATSQNGCGAATSTVTTVIVYPPTPVPIVTAGGTITFCFGGSVVLTSSSATNNQWYKDGSPIGGATGQTYTATVSGSYIVSTSQNGCPAATSTATTVTVYPPTPVPTITPNGTTTICFGGSVTLTSSSATGNQWFKNGNIMSGATGQTFNVTSTGNYLVAVSQNGCPLASSGVTTVTVNHPVPVPTITSNGPTALCGGGGVVLTSSSATGNQWYKDGNVIAGATGRQYNALTSGSYMVVVSDNVCPAASSSVTTVTINSFSISASAAQDPVSCSTGMTNITVTPTQGIGTVSYSLTTPTGEIILAQAAGNSSVTFSNVGAGLYTITATNGNAQSCVASTTLTLNSSSSVVFTNVAVVNNTCFNGITGQISISGTGAGTITYTINKSGGNVSLSAASGATVTFTGLAAGYYNITATDINNCLVAMTVSVGQPNLIQAPQNNNGAPDLLLTSVITPPTATFTSGSIVTITYTISSKTNSNIAAQGVILRISKPFSGYQVSLVSGSPWTVINNNALFTEIQLNAGYQVSCSGNMSVVITIKRNGFDSQSSGLPITASVRMPNITQDLSDFDNARSSLFRVQ